MLVTIGDNDNTQSSIRDIKNGTVLTQVAGTEIDCIKWRAFWISWKDRKVSVGRGVNPELDTFMSADIPSGHYVSAVALSTGNVHNGTWKIHTSVVQGL